MSSVSVTGPASEHPTKDRYQATALRRSRRFGSRLLVRQVLDHFGEAAGPSGFRVVGVEYATEVIFGGERAAQGFLDLVESRNDRARRKALDLSSYRGAGQRDRGCADGACLCVYPAEGLRGCARNNHGCDGRQMLIHSLRLEEPQKVDVLLRTSVITNGCSQRAISGDKKTLVVGPVSQQVQDALVRLELADVHEAPGPRRSSDLRRSRNKVWHHARPACHGRDRAHKVVTSGFRWENDDVGVLEEAAASLPPLEAGGRNREGAAAAIALVHDRGQPRARDATSAKLAPERERSRSADRHEVVHSENDRHRQPSR